eukprot:Rhum_TRINITY_DN14717_c22_g1::Rhum_TRINITY_DN14717_c22_g1_i1::g.114081::m.114081
MVRSVPPLRVVRVAHRSHRRPRSHILRHRQLVERGLHEACRGLCTHLYGRSVEQPRDAVQALRRGRRAVEPRQHRAPLRLQRRVAALVRVRVGGVVGVVVGLLRGARALVVLVLQQDALLRRRVVCAAGRSLLRRRGLLVHGVSLRRLPRLQLLRLVPRRLAALLVVVVRQVRHGVPVLRPPAPALVVLRQRLDGRHRRSRSAHRRRLAAVAHGGVRRGGARRGEGHGAGLPALRGAGAGHARRRDAGASAGNALALRRHGNLAELRHAAAKLRLRLLLLLLGASSVQDLAQVVTEADGPRCGAVVVLVVRRRVQRRQRQVTAAVLVVAAARLVQRPHDGRGPRRLRRGPRVEGQLLQVRLLVLQRLVRGGGGVEGGGGGDAAF